LSENYIVINGKRTELTEEQLKQLKTHRLGERWSCDELGVVGLDKPFPQCKFEFVSWDEEPWEVPHD